MSIIRGSKLGRIRPVTEVNIDVHDNSYLSEYLQVTTRCTCKNDHYLSSHKADEETRIHIHNRRQFFIQAEIYAQSTSDATKNEELILIFTKLEAFLKMLITRTDSLNIQCQLNEFHYNRQYYKLKTSYKCC